MLIWVIAFFCIYLVGAATVWLRLSVYKKHKFDRYDLKFNANHIFGVTMTSIVLWPKLLANPTRFFDPDLLFIKTMFFDYAATQRMRGNFLSNLPKCSRHLRYRESEEAPEFVFPRDELASMLKKSLTNFPNLENDAEGALFKWLSQEQIEMDGVTDFPKLWMREVNIADSAVREGIGLPVHCSSCKRDFPIADLVKSDDALRGGWNFNRISCPPGHLLLEGRSIHLST